MLFPWQRDRNLEAYIVIVMRDHKSRHSIDVHNELAEKGIEPSSARLLRALHDLTLDNVLESYREGERFYYKILPVEVWK